MPKRVPKLTHKSTTPAVTHDHARGNANARGYNYRWQQARRVFLDANPLCVHCLAEGRTTAATVVDHIEPHRGDQRLFWDQSNWQALCKPHHDSKTGRGG